MLALNCGHTMKICSCTAVNSRMCESNRQTYEVENINVTSDNIWDLTVWNEYEFASMSFEVTCNRFQGRGDYLNIIKKGEECNFMVISH